MPRIDRALGIILSGDTRIDRHAPSLKFFAQLIQNLRFRLAQILGFGRVAGKIVELERATLFLRRLHELVVVVDQRTTPGVPETGLMAKGSKEFILLPRT